MRNYGGLSYGPPCFRKSVFCKPRFFRCAVSSAVSAARLAPGTEAFAALRWVVMFVCVDLLEKCVLDSCRSSTRDGDLLRISRASCAFGDWSVLVTFEVFFVAFVFCVCVMPKNLSFGFSSGEPRLGSVTFCLRGISLLEASKSLRLRALGSMV